MPSVPAAAPKIEQDLGVRLLMPITIAIDGEDDRNRAHVNANAVQQHRHFDRGDRALRLVEPRPRHIARDDHVEDAPDGVGPRFEVRRALHRADRDEPVLSHADEADDRRGDRDARPQHRSILDDAVDQRRRQDADDRQVIAEAARPHRARGIEPPHRAGLRKGDQPVDRESRQHRRQRVDLRGDAVAPHRITGGRRERRGDRQQPRHAEPARGQEDAHARERAAHRREQVDAIGERADRQPAERHVAIT